MNKLLALFAIICISTASAESINFLVMGDWGGYNSKPYTNEAELACAAQMGKTAEEVNTAFVVAVGDNFYSYGIPTDEYDSRFKDTFEDVFTDQSLDIPFYVCAGNHDWRGNVSAQIEYSNHSDRWTFPNYYYDFTYQVGSKTVQIVMTDSVMLSGNVADQEDSKAQPLGAENPLEADNQLAWIEETLKNSQADYIFAAGHYPVYSACSHGNTKELEENLRPLLEQYGAHYLAGHDHCEEYINEGTGIGYFISGSAHGSWYDADEMNDPPKDSIKYILSDDNNGDTKSGFASIHVDEEGFYVDFIGNDGALHYRTETLPPRNLASKQTFLG